MIVANYLRREAALGFSAVLGVLLLIFTSQQFVRFLSNALDGAIGQDMVLTMLGLQVPVMLPMLLPLALFLGVLLAVGRLYMDSEMVVLRAGGYSEWQMAAWLAPLALALALAVAGAGFWLGPWADARQHRLSEQFESRGDTALLAPGRFQELSGGRRVIYLEAYDEQRKMRRVFIAEQMARGKDGKPAVRLVSAKAGQIVSDAAGNEYLELQDGQRYEGPPGGRAFTVTGFERYQTLLKAQDSRWERSLRSYDLHELWALPSGPERGAELAWRWSAPLATLLLPLLALSLARSNPRQGRYAGILPGIGLYLLYMLLLMGGRNALDSGKLPAVIGLWPVHAALLLLVLVLLARGSGWPWRPALKEVRP